MNKNEAIKKWGIIAYIAAALLSFTIILIIPSTREGFGRLSADYPFPMGFLKFAVLATAGELIAAYIATGKPTMPVKIVWRFLIWGLIGMWITLMMKVYSAAAVALMANGLLPGGDSGFLRALYTSALMNTTFGPTFMAVHKCSDMFLELRAKGEPSGLCSVMKAIDWSRFAGFTILKTVPIFWIPAHTVTFLLPSQYQVIMAAALSVVLGVILSLGNRKKAPKENENQ